MSDSIHTESGKASIKTDTKTYTKFQSRTFWLAVVWSGFVPLGLIAAVLLSPYGIDSGWLTPLVTVAGAIVTAFVGGEKWRKGLREREEAKNGGE